MHRKAPMRLDVVDVIHDRRPKSGNLFSDPVLAERSQTDARSLAAGLSRRAAAAVIILNVDPGGYSAYRARSR
jgi:hypothetical protein